MKRSIAAVAIFLGWACAAWAVTPALLSTLRAVHALSNEEADAGLHPVLSFHPEGHTRAAPARE